MTYTTMKDSAWVGVGNPDWIYVLVPIEGEWYLTRGGVFLLRIPPAYIKPADRRTVEENDKFRKRT